MASVSSAEAENLEIKAVLLNLIIHMRLHFQLLLAPIFLWGYFLTGATPQGDFWIGFIAFHIFLYSGMTAFNSYYDRDRGPVGGLSKPPPVTRALLPFSIVIQILGAILAAQVNLFFFVIYAIIFLLGVAYSHPKIRLKKRPIVGLVTVGVGQGVLASLGGWVCGQPDLAGFEFLDWMGILAVTLVTVGFYPITQIYQIEEDGSRGDLTFAAWAGPGKTFIFGITVQFLAAFLLIYLILQLMGVVETILVAIFYSGLLVYTAYWGKNYRRADVLNNFRRVMMINSATSFGFSVIITAYLFNLL
ncbi:MAG TPA: UbiA family prenyltransferase [Anaerolineales bacterium]